MKYTLPLSDDSFSNSIIQSSWDNSALALVGLAALSFPSVNSTEPSTDPTQHDLNYKIFIAQGAAPIATHWKLNSDKEQNFYQPKTELGKRLLLFRNRAIAKGMKLLDQDEVIDEVLRRRSEKV